MTEIRAVVETRNDVDQLIRSVESLTRRDILIGIPEGPPRPPEDPGDPLIDNATLGYIHEFGAPEANIPARPFLMPGIEETTRQIGPRLEAAAQAAIRMDQSAVEAQLNAIGLTGQSAVRRRITEGPFVPLAPRTLAGRRARGRTGTKPLIDTGQLRRSVTYVIRDAD